MHTIESQKGAALFTIVGIAAVVAVIVPILFILVDNAYDRQANRAAQERYVHMVMALKRHIEDPLICSQLFAGKVMPAVVDSQADLRINWPYAGGANDFGAGWRSPDELLRINQMYMRRTGNVFHTPRIVTVSSGPPRTFNTIPFRVYVLAEQGTLNLSDDDTAPIEPPETVRPILRRDLMIQLHANVDPATGAIFTCFGANSAAAACEAIGGAFNPNGPPELRCQPDLLCFTGFSGLVNDPSECPTVPIPYRPATVGRDATGQENFMCMLCIEDL